MVENRPILNIVSHIVLILGIAIVALPIWITFVAATHDAVRMTQAPIPLLPGSHFWENFQQTLWGSGLSGTEIAPVWRMLLNSLAMAMMISLGKIAISLISAFAIVYFKFPFRMGFFWLIFITLMLPVEVRILPTFEVVADLGMLNSYWGLSVPLIASATATFMFRQVFLTIPDEMLESARIDGAGPMRFFWDIVIPLSRTNIAALFVILFIYGWNQYLWPLLITTDTDMTTIVMSIKQMLEAAEQSPQWNIIMMTALLAMIPPVFVVVAMQKLFVQGLTETDK
ncbi:sn-glycerol-3-phosphate ABC transporter permease UgpE [Tritonibacter mobilis]|jgi:sn-glycerol 3-phosphate transport system permease protein|uniref:sn-glycerol-3-phosphate ABC transporter permease UgpE n=1 Tax=Tritonibacter mobilis TaxID=379347 RepID=UPI0001B8B17F|nr:sn-glycerol-3-phosphate ABC transporter permease UgpE [Tritonibacter mobilis]EEW57334.1 sn-glycerol-3-phosphate transport system permease protein UgpE [Ruegeria sp. TrichCH4B]NHM18914.1 sn-glycerol-3-phosphate ABC transporter permease UgpE [Tritonibacter mobilis]NHM23066.1 sn-glycerol-3-phosphate ABC transporter permease UgpE [Tritonibacter mobilis]SDX82401.1 carbohydrate ABC transporter membrane protein 2, CUT1 family [Tritonibacter mobilis]GLP88547.1 sn-glycerol-3-phosphate transport syst